MSGHFRGGEKFSSHFPVGNRVMTPRMPSHNSIAVNNNNNNNNNLIDIIVPNTQNLAKTITDKQNKYQEVANEICAVWKQKAAQVIQ